MTDTDYLVQLDNIIFHERNSLAIDTYEDCINIAELPPLRLFSMAGLVGKKLFF